MLYFDLASIIPALTPDMIDRMPYANVLQLRALAWARMPGITPIPPGPTWIDEELEKIMG